MWSNEKKKLLISLDQECYAAIKRYAKKHNRSIVNSIQVLLAENPALISSSASSFKDNLPADKDGQDNNDF